MIFADREFFLAQGYLWAVTNTGYFIPDSGEDFSVLPEEWRDS